MRCFSQEPGKRIAKSETCSPHAMSNTAVAVSPSSEKITWSVFRMMARLTPFVYLLLPLPGCESVDHVKTPQQKNLNHNAFNLLSSEVENADATSSDIVDDEDILEELDREPIIHENFYKKISIAADENMRMREVLTQMAQAAGVNIFIAQDIDGSISFVAKDRPMLDILKDICSSSGLKYSINGDSVKIENDSPQLKFYNLSSLNMQRDTQSTMAISTDIFNGGQMAGGAVTNGSANKSSGDSNNGSSSIVNGSAKNDFWEELENTLKTIVGDADGGSYVTVHRQGGLVIAYTTQNKHEEIQKYLRLLKESSETQVLIEAKILEVHLRDEYRSGINWDIISGGAGPMVRQDFDSAGLFAFGIKKPNLSVISGLIEKFGAVKTLSSPRLTILNNHSAVLKVAQNEVIYLPELHKQYGSMSESVNTDFISANIKTIPIGLVMTVQPSIDRKSNSVLLTLRPTISKIASYREVPSFLQGYTQRILGPSGTPQQAQQQPIQIQMQKIPVVDVREMDSVLKLNSGQLVVMGGLMQEVAVNNREGLPGLQDTDFLTGSREKNTSVTELVIFLRATILRQKGKAYHNADKKIYKAFASDLRPLEFKK
jgi:general secretion pathway protein D